MHRPNSSSSVREMQLQVLSRSLSSPVFSEDCLLQLTDLDEAQARVASLQIDVMVLRQQLEAKEVAVSDLHRREAELRSTVSSLNSENAQQQQLLHQFKDQQQLISVLQREAAEAAALQSSFDQLQEAVRQGEESLQLMRTRVAAAESDTGNVRAQLMAAEERVASLKMALKAQADAAAGSFASAAASAVSTTRAEMTQEIASINQRHSNELQHLQLLQQQQRDEYEEELRSLRDQVRLLQDSIVVLNQELGAATAAVHSGQQQRAIMMQPSLSSDSDVAMTTTSLHHDSSALSELRVLLAAKDREFRAVKGM